MNTMEKTSSQTPTLGRNHVGSTPVEQIFEELDVSDDQGLTPQEAEQRRAALAVEHVRHEYDVALARDARRHLLQPRPWPERVHVEQHPGIRAAALGCRQKGVGGAVGCRDVHGRGAHVHG